MKWVEGKSLIIRFTDLIKIRSQIIREGIDVRFLLRVPQAVLKTRRDARKAYMTAGKFPNFPLTNKRLANLSSF